MSLVFFGPSTRDRVMERIERANVQEVCGPKMNPKTSAEEWFAKAEADGNLAPQRKLENEKPQGETVVYEDLLAAWAAGLGAWALVLTRKSRA